MKQENLTIRLTKSEKSTLHKLAILEGKSMTDFIKSKVFENQSSTSEKHENEKHLSLIFQTVLATHKFIQETLGSQISQEKQKEIMDFVVQAVAKINH